MTKAAQPIQGCAACVFIGKITGEYGRYIDFYVKS